MVRKEIISPGRRRRIPEGFGWVDHRLVRENLIGKFNKGALSLYLFLVTVSDEDGVSWYSDDSVCRRLSFSYVELKDSRTELITGELIAYRKPLYQVLELPLRNLDEGFRSALRKAVSSKGCEVRQPVGTEGMGISLHPPGSIYHRDDEVCDALPLSVIIDSMAGRTK